MRKREELHKVVASPFGLVICQRAGMAGKCKVIRCAHNLSELLTDRKGAVNMKLDSMPSGYPSYCRGIRKMSVKNFLVYYLIDKEKKIVRIAAVIRGQSDQIAICRICHYME